MKTNLELNLANLKDRKALRALLDVLDDAPPDGLDVCSGSTEAFDPARVNVWTSTEGAEMVPDVLNVAPNVDQVVTKTVDQPVAVEAKVEEPKPKPKKAKADKKVAKPEEAKKEGPGPKPNARAIVEAVVGVKTGNGTEAEGTIEEVQKVVDPYTPKIDEETIVTIRKVQVKLAKYQALDEMKKAIRDVTGIQKGKLAEIPAGHGPELIKRLTAIAERVENEGK